MYSINFTKRYTKMCLSLHYNVASSYLCVNGTWIHKFKAKVSEVVANSLCLRKTGFNCQIYHFSVDYGASDVDDMLHIHNYLTKKNDIV